MDAVVGNERYIRRLIDPLLDELFSAVPAVLLAGPRACGKTTTARRRANGVLQLDRAGDATLVRADADVALEVRDEPLLIDEWQAVPEVLGAVKRAVDADPRPGRFLLTGSTGEDLGSAGCPATGRVVRVPLWGVSERELEGDVTAMSLLDRLRDSGVDALEQVRNAPDLRSYVERAIRGGQPEIARQASERARIALLDSYVDQATGRDLSPLGAARDPVRLRRYLAACAANTAGVVQHKILYDAAEVSRNTALLYDTSLESTFITERIPAWSGGHLRRQTSAPKRYLIEPALLRPLLGIDERAALRHADILGRLIDTFVAAQLRPELSVAAGSPRLYHLREANGRHEIDLIAEFAGGPLSAFAVKATATPSRHDARHLAWLRDELGDRFIAGIVLHTGPATVALGDRIAATPIAAIWDTKSH